MIGLCIAAGLLIAAAIGSAFQQAYREMKSRERATRIRNFVDGEIRLRRMTRYQCDWLHRLADEMDPAKVEEQL